VEIKICKETAEEQIAQFGKAWGLYDAKAIISGGKESSIPDDVRELFLANVMTGNVEFLEDGKKVVLNLSTPLDDLDKLEFKNKLRAHHIREVRELPEEDQPLHIACACTGVGAGKLSSLTSRDSAVLTAVTVYISFS